MANVDLSRISPPEYPDLIQHWKTDDNKRGSIDGINLVLGAENESAIIAASLDPIEIIRCLRLKVWECGISADDRPRSGKGRQFEA